MASGETQVYEMYDPQSGESFGIAATRYEAAKEAKRMGLRVRRVWVKTIITNRPERFSRCPKR